MAVTWNLWHGCHKLSEGCRNCYVYRTDQKHGRDSAQVEKTASFDLPIRRNRAGEYKIPPGTLCYTCFTSDFFLEDADEWRPKAWRMMCERADLHFLFITKRIARFYECIPEDWGQGYENVAIYCTVEDQQQTGLRLPIYLGAPIRHKGIICEPLLGPVDLTPYLGSAIEEVIAGGESGSEARICDYAWVEALRDQCVEAGVSFHFKQTGARFRKDGRVYRIPRKHQFNQAARAGIDYPARRDDR